MGCGSALRVRVLGREDAQSYQRLRLLALRESPSAFSASFEEEVDRADEEIATRIAASEFVRMFGAFADEKLCGFVALIRPLRAKLRHCAELAGMYVAPEQRGRGAGAALLRAAIAHAASMDGVRQVKLGVIADNVAAKALYRSAGFECWGSEPDALRVNDAFLDQEHYVLRLLHRD